MGSNSVLISRAFWILFTLEVAAWIFLMAWTPRGGKGWGPEGPVGGWIIYVIPPILLAVPLATVLIGRSKPATIVGLAMVAWPIVPLIVGPIYSFFDDFWVNRSIAGDLNFLRPTQRKLAHALRAHDAEQVKALLPQAGDLNATHRGESLFAFALSNADKSDASVEIVRAMLAHGANPNLVTPNKAPVLIFAIGQGAALTKLLLEAGANPNTLDGDMPAWWDVLYQTSPEGRETLRILLDHGADMTIRDSNNGAVGRAAAMKNWRAVWLLMERGAAWKGEKAFGQSILWELDYDMKNRGSGTEIPEEMEKIRARLVAAEVQP